MKTILTLIFLINLVANYAQNEASLDTNFNMEVTDITFKKSVTATLQVVVAKKGYKIITLETIFNSKSRKRQLLDLKRFKFVADETEYTLVTQQGLGVWNRTTGLRLKFKGEKKTKLYIQVKDDIKEGTLYFDDNAIYEVKVSNQSKQGEIKKI